MSQKHHPLPLWALFLVLLGLTVAEVGLYEVWSRHQGIMPKYAMVLLLFIFTIPKAAIVLIYFMHLKFERQLVVAVALLPFLTAAIAVIPTLTDIMTLKSDSYNEVEGLGDYAPISHGGDDHGHEDDAVKDEDDDADAHHEAH